jgi:hypothetical protein
LNYQPRYLSSNGRLFFDSADALVPADVNGREDVYEYEPEGTGSCRATTEGSSMVFAASEGGCVALISSGTSPEESAFLDASEEGREVFFLTASRLVPQDYDNALDVYDAHECTSDSPFPPAVAVSPPPCTTAEGCRAAPTPQPAIFGAPSSATFSGAGNITPSVTKVKTVKAKAKPCAKGHAKKHGKCVAVKRKKRKPRARKAGAERRAKS